MLRLKSTKKRLMEQRKRLEEDSLGTARAQFRQIWQNMEHKARIGNLPALAAAENHLIAEQASNLAKPEVAENVVHKLKEKLSK